MPVNENDFREFGNNNISSSNMMSKAELRKTHKPIMEKRRRAKINNCLEEIKALVLKALKKDPERHSKLEKADILEMAVKHLKNVQKQQREHAIQTDPVIAQKYRTGYRECMQEVNEYVDGMEGIDLGSRQRIKVHLSKCMSGVEYNTLSMGNSSSNLLATFAKNHHQSVIQGNHSNSLNSSSGSSEDDLNNNPKFNGIELIPSCLPNGDFAFVVPKTSLNTMLTPHSDSEEGQNVNVRPSAFVTVIQSNKPRPLLSPPLSPSSSSDDLIQAYPSRTLTPPAQIPRSFKPVISKPIAKHMVTSTVTSNEIQQIKYPIHNYAGPQLPPKKDEPLCVITNQSERHKHAQILEDSKHYVENAYHEPRGIKRLREHTGLLSLVGSSVPEPPQKMLKISVEGSLPLGKTFMPKIVKAKIYDASMMEQKPSTSKPRSSLETITEEASSSSDDKAGVDSMWRPW